jgi:hypothetical protein
MSGLSTVSTVSTVSTRDKILNSIIELRNKDDNSVVSIQTKELKLESSKYSSVKNNIWHVFINNEKIKKTSDLIFHYKCLTCSKINVCASTQFLRKIRQCKSQCFQCNITNLNNNIDISIITLEKPLNDKPKTYHELYKISKQEFEMYPDQYKNSYMLSHLSDDDYKRIKSNIISFCNGKYCNIEEYEYWSVFKVNNQMKFSYVLYDTISETIFKAHQPIMKCDNCEKTWRCKSLEIFKNCYKILCNDCKLCNRVFKIRPTKNINNDIITYQSKLELKFIEWCTNNNIVVTNGPNIDYIFKEKRHKYRLDFQIEFNNSKFLIEIKDFHIWHKNQVESGLWNEKLNAVDRYIQDNNEKHDTITKYYFITPNNWKQKTKELINELQKYNNLDTIT